MFTFILERFFFICASFYNYILRDNFNYVPISFKTKPTALGFWCYISKNKTSLEKNGI